jgi:SAM-dependent methyltransferase
MPDELRPRSAPFGADLAAGYDISRGVPAEATDGLYARVAVATGLSRSSRLLDAGCGTGVLARPFVDACRYTGVDASAEMLAQFRSSPGLGGADLVQADLPRLPFPSGCFSTLLAFRVLGIVPGWRRTIAEFLRVLQPGGFLISGRIEHQPDSVQAFVRAARNRLLAESDGELRGPGGNADAVVAALTAERLEPVAIEPIVWRLASLPRQAIDQNLTGWRLQALPPQAREDLRAQLTRLARDRYGDPDLPQEEEPALVLHCFRVER